MSMMLSSLSFAKIAPHLATVGALILLVAIGHGGYMALEETESVTAVSEALNDPSMREKRIQSKIVDYATISQWHLFGDSAKSTALPTASIKIDAPETRLKLFLLGVLLDSKAGQSFAIIGEKGKPQKAYSIDDEINANTILYAIESDRVILKRNGRHEQLSMKNKALDLASMSGKQSTSSQSKRTK